MARDLTEPQVITAIEDTKRGYGLWRGEVLHPASPRVDAALESGEPITDTKGLGLRYVPVRGDRVIPHFRVHDPEKFSAALDRAFPAVHDAVVRLVAEDVRAGGFAALERWCAGASLPGRFDVAGVHVEKPCVEGAVRYRPDIVVEHPAGGRVELEVVNTHAPESARLEAAWGAGHIVLSLRIRDLVEALVFSEGRGLVPDDATLRGLLKGRRFVLCGHERVPSEVRVIWRDLDLAHYAVHLGQSLSAEVKAVQGFTRDTCLLVEGFVAYADDHALLNMPDGAVDTEGKCYADYQRHRWIACAPERETLRRSLQEILGVALRVLPQQETALFARGDSYLRAHAAGSARGQALDHALGYLEAVCTGGRASWRRAASSLALCQRLMNHTHFIPDSPARWAKEYPR